MAMRLHGDGVCAIGKALNRSSGTISGELKRLYSVEQIEAAKGRRIKPLTPYDALRSGEHARRKRLKRRRLCNLMQTEIFGPALNFFCAMPGLRSRYR